VINSQRTAAGAVHRALQGLAQVNVPVMGAVLNRLEATGRGYYYYHYYYSHDYYGTGEKAPRRRKAPPQGEAPLEAAATAAYEAHGV
jgi:Mrp family chromosome partitioning ATPase